MRKNVHNTSGIRVHITGAFRNYGKNGAPMEEYFGKKLRTHQSEMDEGCHHCKKYGYQLIIKEYGKNPGLLLVHGICYCKGAELPESAHGWRRLMQSVHIIPDNISSFVHAYGLRLLTNEGWHPAYESFCSRKEPYVITMENLCGIVGALPAGTQAGQAQSGTILQSGLVQMESVN